MAYHILPVLSIKNLINENGDPTMPSKLATGRKPSVSNLRVLFCPCVSRKATAHVVTCVAKRKRIFVVSSLEFHSIKKGSLSTYVVKGR